MKDVLSSSDTSAVPGSQPAAAAVESDAKVTVELETYNGLPVVYLLYSGFYRDARTHSLRCICTTSAAAEERRKGYSQYEKEHYNADELLQWWVEPMALDHMFGEAAMRKARDVIREFYRKNRQGD